MSPKARPESEAIAPLDCIFACSVCGDVFSDVYNQQESVHGLSDGINTKERIVTRLYVSSCCHVICIKHLGGGNGPAFHPAGQHPEAPCPVCVKESGDETPRQLFSVRGFGDGEHDPAIPKFWFKAPPMKLEGKDQEMEALRFQYLALIRFSKNVASSYREAAKGRAEAESKFQEMQDVAMEEFGKAKALQKEVERLRTCEGAEQALHRHEARLPLIRYYLDLMPKLVEQNNAMSERLRTLGFAMHLEPIPDFKGPYPFDDNDTLVDDEEGDVPMESRKTGSSHTVGRSAHNTGYGEEAEEEEVSSGSRQQRPLKRSRVDSPVRANNIHAAPSSRDLMPPPPKPLSKMSSIRRIIPNLKNKFSNGRSSATPRRKPVSSPDVQMYDNGQSDGDERPPTRHGLPSDEGPYMSGALPPNDRFKNVPPQSGLLAGLGIHSNDSDFTFEAPSRPKIPDQRSNQGSLPVERSYIRLLDGLGRHGTLDLGLEDPRQHHQENHTMLNQSRQQARKPEVARQQQACRDAPRIQTQNHQKQWNFGHAFLQQSPINANPTSAYYRSDNNHAEQHDATMHSSPNRGLVNPTSPTPARSHRPTDEVDHVVSPFFGSSNQLSQPFSRSQFTEPDISSSRSVVYQSNRPTDTDWREPRSLNGLSFFDSPVNVRNERIEWRREPKPKRYVAPLRQHQARNINSQGFLMRPNEGPSPMQHDSTYGSLDRPYSRQVPVQSHAAIPLPSFSRSSHSRASRLPSAMPSIISGCSPRRLRSQAENLGKFGVRSSQHSRPHISGNTFASPVRPAYSSAGRRVMRR